MGRAFGTLLPDAVLLDRRELDVTDPDAVWRTIRRGGAEVVIHAAAWTGVDSAERHPGDAWRVNVEGTQAVTEATASIGAMLVYLSTDYVFSGRARRPYKESHRPSPRSVYGITKLRGEDAARTCERHLIVRTSWLFGEGGNFVQAILSAAAERPEVRVVSDQTGLPTYAPHLAHGILGLIDAGTNGTFHLAGGGEPCSWADLADAALGSARARSLVPSPAIVRRVRTLEYAREREEPLAPRPSFSALDCSKARRHGVELRPWREGLRDYLEKLPSAPVGPDVRGAG